MATLTALVALSIDMVLPALPAIGASLGVRHANENQLVVSLLFLGFGIGQLFYGPLSDTAGRKPAAFLGLVIFSAGCLLALLAQTSSMMLAGRLLQGIGVAGPRTITIALVRDRFEGREMARVMSLVTAVFILVPIVAPALGQVVLGAFGWRAIFVVYLAMGLITSVWFGLRQEETLPAGRRMPFSLARLGAAAREVLTNRVAVSYTVAAGFVFGAFLGYLTSAQQILQEQYALGARFPLYFGTLAVAIGGASLANARLVMRYGMRALSQWSLWGIFAVSIVFTGVAARGRRASAALDADGLPDGVVLRHRPAVRQPERAGDAAARRHRRHRVGGGGRPVDADLADARHRDRPDLQRYRLAACRWASRF